MERRTGRALPGPVVLLPVRFQCVRHLRTKMAGEYLGRELVEIVLHRWRPQHFSELHSAPGGKPSRSAERNFGRHSGSLGSVNRGPGRLLELRVFSRCPAGGVDTFKIFNGNNGKFDASQVAVYKDNVQSFSTTEPGIDLTATSFLMWSWRLPGRPSF